MVLGLVGAGAAIPHAARAEQTESFESSSSPSAGLAPPVSSDRDPWYSSGLFGTDPREPVYLPLGLLLSWPLEQVLGIGAEVSLDVYHERNCHYGFVAQAQYELAVGADRGRFALGPQLGTQGLGVELAAALRTHSPEHAASIGLQVAPFASLFGFASLAVRITSRGLAVGHSEQQAWPTELALAFTLKWPLSLQGNLYCTGSALYCQPGAPRPAP